MSLDLTKVIESAADDVAHAGRAAAETINDLVHEWGHETKSFVTEHAPSLPGRSRHRGPNLSIVRLLLPVAVLAVIAMVIIRRRRSSSPYLPERSPQEEVRETVLAEGAAAS
jgi:hypothetical protein